jgi:cyanate permease
VAFLPVLGLSFLSPAVASLAERQSEFFALGLLSNLFGIGIMLRLMEKSGGLPVRTWMNNFNVGLNRS